ncbi:XTP/dITP diphosphatase [Aurantivibrio plasticivorans]
MIVIASNNTGKLKEFKRILADLPFSLKTQADYSVSSADETGLSFVENAILKARHASRETQLPALADDSGLSVDALQGAPGIYSARYAGTQGDDAANNARLLDNLKSVPDELRTARFHCALAYVRYPEDPCPIICQASWEGRILKKAQGENGFGYDPLFFVAEKNCSSAELPPEVKNKISHRGQAMAKLLIELKQSIF